MQATYFHASMGFKSVNYLSHGIMQIMTQKSTDEQCNTVLEQLQRTAHAKTICQVCKKQVTCIFQVTSVVTKRSSYQVQMHLRISVLTEHKRMCSIHLFKFLLKKVDLIVSEGTNTSLLQVLYAHSQSLKAQEMNQHINTRMQH